MFKFTAYRGEIEECCDGGQKEVEKSISPSFRLELVTILGFVWCCCLPEIVANLGKSCSGFGLPGESTSNGCMGHLPVLVACRSSCDASDDDMSAGLESGEGDLDGDSGI